MADGSNSYSVHFQMPMEDGTHQWTHVQARILRSEDGRAHRVIGVVRDATAEVTHSAFVLDLEKRQPASDEHRRTHNDGDVTRGDRGRRHRGAHRSGGLVGIGADGLALGLVENSALKIIALSGDSVEVLAGLGAGPLDATLPLGDTILSGRPRFITSLGALVQRYPALEPHIGELKFRAVAYLPLIAQARPLGGLALFYRERTAFSADERILCLGLAAIVAQSLQRAILFDEEREFATGLQSAMLPRRIQEIEGGEIAVRYHSAWSGREVGGDWYDVVTLPRGRIGVAVGDVQGHDTHAAAIMGQLRIALRAYAAEGHPRPRSWRGRPASSRNWTPTGSPRRRTRRWISPRERCGWRARGISGR